MQKIYRDEILGDVTIRKNVRTRRLSLRVSPSSGIMVTIPYWVPYREGVAFLERNRQFVQTTLNRIGNVSDEQIEAWRKEAKATLPYRLMELADKYGFKVNRVTIKHNRSNWGSCSRLGNINLNLNLVRLPDDIRDYVILHELCHLRYMNHGPEFHNLLEELCRKEFGDENGENSVHISKRKQLKQYTLY